MSRFIHQPDCFFCQPLLDINAYSLKIADLQASTLRLSRDQTYPGCCMLIYSGGHATGIEQLLSAEYSALMADLRVAAQAITAAMQPDHMNYAILGNSVPHLHWHIIPRYKTDRNWGSNPFWRQDQIEEQQAMAEPDYHKRVAAIRHNIETIEEGYKALASNQLAEREAAEWVEGMIGDIADG